MGGYLILLVAIGIVAFDTYEEPTDPTDSPKVQWRKALPMVVRDEPVSTVDYTTNENEDP